MAATEVEICNAALSRLGAPAISSLLDVDKKAQTCSLMYPRTRDNLLRSHPWNFALRRVELTKSVISINFGTDVITVAKAPETGSQVVIVPNDIGDMPGRFITDALIEGQTYYVINVSATTFKLADTKAQAEAGTAISLVDIGGGTSYFCYFIPDFGYSYRLVLPTDYLRVFRLEHSDIEYKVEGGYLLCNESSLRMVYIAKITDVTKFDPMFDHLLSVMLAHEMSYSLVQSATVKSELAREVQILLRDVRSADAQEGSPENFEFNTWTEARY